MYSSILNIQNFDFSDDILMSLVEQEVFVVFEVFGASVSADKRRCVAIYRKLGYEYKHFLTVSKGGFKELECI